nr:uncharacterized protein LOC104103414 [Nicotiana tomentosiformis]
MVNGKTTKTFDAAKGLRQGDPISPYLFAMAIEYLSRKLHKLRDDKSFNFHPRCAKLKITHLSFTNDLLLFSRGDLKSVNALHQAFKQFSEASGLQTNLQKSSIYFGGVDHVQRDRIVHKFGIPAGDLPIRSFVWSGTETITKKALASWEKMCFPRTFGGLNLFNRRIWNRASLAKTHWDLAHKDDKLWIK